jgi:hypothetical protein
MMPGSGFDVVQVEDGHCFAAPAEHVALPGLLHHR